MHVKSGFSFSLLLRGGDLEGYFVFAEFFELDIIADALFYVIGRKALPDDIRYVARNVIKHSGVDRHIVNEREKSDT